MPVRLTGTSRSRACARALAGLVADRSARGAVSGPDDKDYSRAIQQVAQPLLHCFASGEIPVEPERNFSILQCLD